ncbi:MULTISPECIES: alanine racemase [Clostridium]|uniref:Alanine racemase n=1 Tax=Clostridium disporicum TaxID=84024 RepID=A0A174JZ99_9CLOT|nr:MULTISPECIES: alanine racemase [Clostridium]MCD2502973.1 alanine racemase [Clostridium sp. NSJ-145]CUP03107.1 alanine racemase [Clostridium disporicum]
MDVNIRPVWAEVNLDNIINNIKEIKKNINGEEIIAVVKANAYGHGAVDVAPVLIENGADRLAVAMLSEALELREAGIKVPILILGYTDVAFSEMLINNDIEQTVYSLDYAKELSKKAEALGKVAKIHIAVDTGMGRIGFLPNEKSVEEVVEISKLSNLRITGIFTHFSNADEQDKSYAHNQIEKFNSFINEIEKREVNLGLKHISNSASIIDIEDAHYNAIRPGIILYGYYPSDYINKDKLKLMPALSLKCQVIHVKELPKGEYIGYGRKFRTERDSVIATLPIGYADGYVRGLYEKAHVIINGKLAPVVGKICMDQCMVDVTDIGPVKVGDEVVLLGEDNGVKNNADDMAKMLDTINYEILCMIGRRVPRIYIKDGKMVNVRNYL